MINKISEIADKGFEWLEIVAPTEKEFQEIAAQYKLHPALVNDCMQPDHLPKFERMENYSFIIFRIFADNDEVEADTVQELTNKIAIFYSDQFILTVHRQEQSLFEKVVDSVKHKHCNNTHALLNILINECLNTYEDPLKNLSKMVDEYEAIVFLHPRKAPLLKGLYYLKRKIDLLKQMLILSYDVIDNVDPKARSSAETRDTRDHYVKLQNMYASLSENIHQLLNVYFSASSQRTNETMRILTIFSVFFMPLTFIVGIYGMNFKYMPELEWKQGYPAVMLLMAFVTLLIYIWFKRKKWL
jgi:magnesium transporter